MTKKIKLIDPPTAVRHHNPSVVGTAWDSVNFSCAYDSLFGILYKIWLDNTILRTSQIKHLSPQMDLLIQGFNNVANSAATLEEIRDNVRHTVHSLEPMDFPYGHNNASVEKLAMKMVVDKACGEAVTHCDTCNVSLPGQTVTFSPHLNVVPSANRIPRTLQDWMNNHFNKSTNAPCFKCWESDHVHRNLIRTTTLTDVPLLLFVGFSTNRVSIDQVLKLHCNDRLNVIHLRGIVYYAELHFTSRIITPSGDIYFHDGISTQKSTVFEGNILDLASLHTLHYHNGDAALLAVYSGM
ncbi:hypothetical protein C8J57DRAFT_1081696 [Mycena rebaudengoi]|nr:hypothetical protein C8J57DRAFT_1081696 [Mycena rebaudengoi]